MHHFRKQPRRRIESSLLLVSALVLYSGAYQLLKESGSALLCRGTMRGTLARTWSPLMRTAPFHSALAYLHRLGTPVDESNTDKLLHEMNNARRTKAMP